MNMQDRRIEKLKNKNTKSTKFAKNSEVFQPLVVGWLILE